jgi:hypothetical protein
MTTTIFSLANNRRITLDFNPEFASDKHFKAPAPFPLYTCEAARKLHHLLNHFPQHHQSIICILSPRLAKTDADTIIVIAICRKQFSRHRIRTGKDEDVYGWNYVV